MLRILIGPPRASWSIERFERFASVRIFDAGERRWFQRRRDGQRSPLIRASRTFSPRGGEKALEARCIASSFSPLTEGRRCRRRMRGLSAVSDRAPSPGLDGDQRRVAFSDATRARHTHPERRRAEELVGEMRSLVRADRLRDIAFRSFEPLVLQVLSESDNDEQDLRVRMDLLSNRRCRDRGRGADRSLGHRDDRGTGLHFPARIGHGGPE